MAAKYAAIIGYDGNGSFALACAVKNNDGSVAAVDSGLTTTAQNAQLLEAAAALAAAGYTVQRNLYASNLLATTQAAVLTLAGTL